MKKAPTLKDVALIAGVSPYTVSAVLNGARSNTQVSEATRRRIMESARQLDYHPSAVARSLANRKTNTLGVLFGVLQPTEAMGNAYASALLKGIMGEAAQHHYNVLLYTEPWVRAEQSAPTFRDRRTDGLALIAPLNDTDMLSALSALPLSLVAVSPDPVDCPPHVATVDVDNVRGVELAVEHLVNLGHRRIAHFTGDANVGSVAIRREAFIHALATQGLATPPEYIVPSHYDAHSVPELLPRLLALPEPPTAIVAGNDNLALTIVATCRRLGIVVPDKLSVVGFDDVPSAAQVTPALTSVRQPLEQIGAETVRLLLAEINTPRDAESTEKRIPILLAPELIVRASTAPPRTSP